MAAMFGIQSTEIKNMERQLKTLARQALPYATQKTLNDTAFDAMKTIKANINAKMVTRNTWTERSIRVEKSGRGAISSQKAIVGSTADYMEAQEFGGTKQGHSIPTSYSAGQSGNSRTRVPRKANRITNISLATRYASRGASNKQRNFLAVRSRESFIYMDLGHRRGIFRVTGSKKTPKINMVQDLTRSSTPIPKTPTIGPGFNEALTRLPAYYADALRFQLDRLGLL